MLYQLKKPIVLVGLMGVGKTTVGKRLAKDLHVPFVDLDMAVEDDQGCSISQIFDYAGQEAFREIESRLLREQLNGELKVLATGGGVILSESNRNYIKDKAISVWLQASLGSLIERTSHRNHRPLLEGGGDRAEILEQLLAERTPLYKQADFTIKTDCGPHYKIPEDIIEMIKNYEI